VPATETNQDERLKSPQIIQGTKATRYPGGTLRARVQSVQSVTNGIISVKLLDSDHNVTGEAFDVYCFWDQGVRDIDEYIPVVRVVPPHDDISIIRIGGIWYLNAQLTYTGKW